VPPPACVPDGIPPMLGPDDVQAACDRYGIPECLQQMIEALEELLKQKQGSLGIDPGEEGAGPS